jgi:hypothetical protein
MCCCSREVVSGVVQSPTVTQTAPTSAIAMTFSTSPAFAMSAGRTLPLA